MTLAKLLGYCGFLCMMPLMIKQINAKTKMAQFLNRNHYAIGWLMLLLIIPHILFSFSNLTNYPFGLLALLCLLFLDGFIVVRKKTKTSRTVHKYVALLLLVFSAFHVFFE